jgi:2-oxoisovalerate dehydrogenase E1 component
MNWIEESSTAPLRRLEVEPADWQRQPPRELRWLLQLMLVIRRFEERLLALHAAGLIHGPVHTSIGQEGIAAGLGAALRPQDRVAGTHRAHHQYLAKVLSACRPADYEPLRDPFPERMIHEIEVLLAEIMGLRTGCCGGRGGSMHLYRPAAGVIGTNAIVAAGAPHATGVAWADQFQGRDAVTVCFFGDGSLYQGVLDEASNLARLWRAPVVYFIENNQYSVGTTLAESCSAARLHEKAVAYGMAGLAVDGMNALAVQLALATIVQRRADGWLPCYVNAETYRYFHHAGPTAGSAYGYRAKTEEQAWRARDPLEQCRRELRRLGALDDAGDARLEANASAAIDRALAACTVSARGQIEVRAELWPAAASVFTGVRGDEPSGPTVEEPDLACDREVKYVEAIAAVTGRWLEREPLAFVLGEEVANLGGGAYGATKGLPARFPDRVRNTPISEAGFVGLACGAALNGMRPIVEIMFSSFVLVAADQLLNQLGQLRHIYGGAPSLPVLVRTRVAIGLGYGAQHSLDPAALFALFPGWRICCPTTPFDYIGLFNAAMRSRRPTLFIEHQELYARKGRIPADNLDFVVAPGRARVRRAGRDVTVLAWSWMTPQALAAAAALEADGIAAEVIDLRTLDDAGVDYDLIGRSLARTGALVVVDEAPAANSLAAKLISQCVRRFFDELDGPPVAVTAPDVPVPVSRPLEAACRPSVEQVAAAIRAAARRQS